VTALSRACPQIEHHLYPAVSFMHYPAISKIVREEAEKRGIPYNHYGTLPQVRHSFLGPTLVLPSAAAAAC
jgi:fatty acid desaturase (delta-4 desaturase)